MYRISNYHSKELENTKHTPIMNMKNKKGNLLGYLLKEPFPWIAMGIRLLSWPRERISCILSGQSEFSLRAKSSTSLINK